MARKVVTYKVESDDRDEGKVFVITEMPATQGQRWALRAFLALARNGVEVPDNVKQLGMAGMVKMGFEAIGRLPFEEADSLMNILMGCVQCMPDASRPNVVRALVESDIDEIATRFKLCAEAFKVHVDFSKVGGSLTQDSAPATSMTE